MLVHCRVTPRIKFTGTHLYTWVERGTVRVKCLAQEHNTMSPARARTRTVQSGDEHTNHEATAPPTSANYIYFTSFFLVTVSVHQAEVSKTVRAFPGFCNTCYLTQRACSALWMGASPLPNHPSIKFTGAHFQWKEALQK